MLGNNDKCKMSLAIDIGNTNIDVALFKGETYLRQWRMFTDVRRTGDEYSSIIQSFFRDADINASECIEWASLSSVVPGLTGAFVTAVESLIGKKPVVVSPSYYANLPVKITSNEMGTDLVCDALEAWCRYKEACITVDFGTALTFTAINGKGEVSGIAIAPGLATAMKSLFSNTAQLPQVPLEVPPSVLGMNTTACIQSGVVLGYKGLVEYIVARMKKEMAEKYGDDASKIHVVATGGLNSVLQPVTDIFEDVDKHLTLCGVRRFGELAQNS